MSTIRKRIATSVCFLTLIPICVVTANTTDGSLPPTTSKLKGPHLVLQSKSREHHILSWQHSHDLSESQDNTEANQVSDEEDEGELGDLLSEDESVSSTPTADSKDNEKVKEEEEEDSGLSFAEKLKENLKINLGLVFLKLGQKPTIRRMVDPKSTQTSEYIGLPKIPLTQYAADIGFQSHAKLGQYTKFKMDMFLDLTHLPEGLKNTVPFGDRHKVTLDKTRYYLGAKELYFEASDKSVDLFLGKRIISIDAQPEMGSITNLYNTSIVSSFMPMTAGAWQASMDYAINENNSLTFALFPLPRSTIFTPQLFMWGEGYLNYANFFGEIFSNLGGNTEDFDPDDIDKTKYTGIAKQWSYYTGYQGSSGDFHRYLTLYYGLSQYWTIAEDDADGLLIYHPKLWQITSGLNWQKGNWKLYSELMGSYAPNKDDDDYASVLLGIEYDLNSLASKLGLSMLKINLQAAREKIFKTPPLEYWKNKREGVSDPLWNAYFVSSYGFRTANRAITFNTTIGYNDKLFAILGATATIDPYKKNGKKKYKVHAVAMTGVRYMYSDNLNITGFYIHSTSMYLIGANSMGGISFNYQLK